MKRITVLTFLLLSNICYSQTWSELTSGVTTQLTSVSAYNENYVWVCGYSGVVLRTTNGGTNWTNVSSAPIPNTLNLTNIFGTDSVTALVTGSTASVTFVYRTTNSGANWVQVFTQANGFIDAIWMGNAQAGFMVGDPVGGRWSLWGTITGGVTWDSTNFRLPQAGTEAGWNNCFFFDPISQAVWFGTSNTRTYRSTNLILWSTQPTTGQVNSYAIWFNSGFNGMTGGTQTMLTTNSGAVWLPTASALPGTANISGITGLASNWWVTRQSTAIYYTNNDGGAWASQYTAPAGSYLHITKTRNGITVLFAVRSNGGISKGTGFVGLVPTVSGVPKYFRLDQNYPNPFNPNTKIKFAIPDVVNGHDRSLPVILKVYDELGREAAVLVNEKLSPGSYEYTFDASNLSSGVYYYKLFAGTFTDTKKMVLMK